MPKIMIKDYRDQYEKLTGKKASVNWNKAKIQKMIKLYQAEKAIDSELQNKPDKVSIEPNPEFEKMLDNNILSPDSGNIADVPQEPQTDGRGGYREGAGRPIGQTDARAKAERMLNLEVPDLGVSMAVDILNSSLTNFTGVGIDEKSITGESIKDMPTGSKSLALGLTKILYYWFPNLQNRADVLTLHLQSLFLMLNPFRERAIVLGLMKKAKEEQQKQEVKVQVETPIVTPAPVVLEEKPVTQNIQVV